MGDTVARLDNEFFNHDGQPGLKTQFLVFITEQKAIRETRKESDEQLRLALQAQNDKQNRRWNAVIAIAAILTVLLGLLVYLHSVEVRQGKLKIPRISDFQPTDSVVSSSQQNAGSTPHM